MFFDVDEQILHVLEVFTSWTDDLVVLSLSPLTLFYIFKYAVFARSD